MSGRISEDSPLSIFLVDDHSVFRSGVRAELAGASGIHVAGEAGSVDEAIAGIEQTRPDVVLLDVHMPNGGGRAVLTAVTSHMRGQSPVFLALSVSDAAEDVIAVVRSGARGYVTKSISGDELVDAIRRVAGGDAFFSPRLAGFVLDAFCAPDPAIGLPGVISDDSGEESSNAGEDVKAASRDEEVEVVHRDDPIVDALTRRELEVLKLLARGYTYREIGAELFISVKTVESHSSNILRKTQQSNRYALSRWATARDLD